MISKRSTQLELIDQGPSYYTPAEYRDCLYQLDRIGRFLGGDQASIWALNQLKVVPHSLLDVGCGGGLFTMRLAHRYPTINFTGIDISKDAITFALEHLNRFTPPLTNLQFFVPSTPQLQDLNQSFDIIMSTLVCHHLSDQELISFLQQSCRFAKQAVIINDLHRHPLASLGFATLVPLLFRNRLIWHDGLLSIKRSFTRKDWIKYIEAAGIDKKYCKISWHWAFRWMIIIDTAAMKDQS